MYSEKQRRWRKALIGSLAIHAWLFSTVGAFWHWDFQRSRQPIYVEVSMADLLAPVETGGGGTPTPAKAGASPPSRADAAFSPPDRFSSNEATMGPSTGYTGGTAGSGQGNGNGTGTGTGSGTGRGSGAGPGSGATQGPTRGPRLVEGGRPDYPEIARNKGWEGTVKLQILINTSGSVDEVRIAAGSGHEELDRAAQRAVRSWRFTPALQKGAPVAAWVTLPVVFDLQ